MKRTIHIEGMHCGHCAGMVNIELYRIKEVVDAKVDIGDKKAVVSLSRDVDPQVLINAVVKAGYKVTSIE